MQPNTLSNLIRRYATPYPYQVKAEKVGELYRTIPPSR